MSAEDCVSLLRIWIEHCSKSNSFDKDDYLNAEAISGHVTADTVTVGDVLAVMEIQSRFLERLGLVFKPPAKDSRGNMKKLENGAIEAFKNDVDQRTIRELINLEIGNKIEKRDPSSSVGALWSKRGLEFMTNILRLTLADHDSNADESTFEVSQKAYANSLKRHHNWLAAKTFQVGFVQHRNVPHMATFFVIKQLAARGSPYRTQMLINMAYEAGKTKDQMTEFEAVVAEVRVIYKLFVHLVTVLNQLLVELGIEQSYQLVL